MNPITRALVAVKGFAMRWSGFVSWSGAGGYGGWGGHLWQSGAFQGGSRRNWAADVGDGRSNAAVLACIAAIQRAFPEAPMLVSTRAANGETKPALDHAMMQLLERPNPHYSGHHLWAATVADFALQGNAYWIKVRSGARRVVELWWVPSFTMEPRWSQDGSDFISHYDYAANNQIMRIEPSEVVHFRDGFDPENVRKGMSRLAGLFREIATDNEAANWSASLLRNMGVPGVVINPEGDERPTREEAEAIKSEFANRFSGDRRGEPLFMAGPTKVSVLSFSPAQMNMKELRRVPEERISAALGVPAIVAGLGAGLDHATYSNVAQAREAFYESCLIPMQRLLAAEVQSQLVPDFGDPMRLRVSFDLSQVRVLQQDMNELHARAREDWLAGIITLNQALEVMGHDVLPGPEGDVRLIPHTGSLTTPADLLAPPTPQPTITDVTPQSEALPPGQPAKLLSLAGRAERKGADDVLPALQRYRQTAESDWTDAIAEFLTEQSHRVAGRLDGAKAVDVPSADDLVPASEVGQLRVVLDPLYTAALDAVHDTTVAALGVAFDLPDPAVTEYLRTAGGYTPGITDTTREAVRTALAEGQAAGEGIPQLAARLRGLGAFGRIRATTIARTELGHAQNTAALANYRASGVVVGVRVLDGDHDEACAAMNGRTFPLDQAPPALEHTRCVRAFAPLTDPAALEGAA